MCERGLRLQRGPEGMEGKWVTLPKSQKWVCWGISSVLCQHGCAPGSASATMGPSWACLEERPALGPQGTLTPCRVLVGQREALCVLGCKYLARPVQGKCLRTRLF